MHMPTLLLVNGPNLGTLGIRKPEIYGRKTLADVEGEVSAVASAAGWQCKACQSNHEGALIDFIEQHRDAAAMVINPGALMMSGWGLRDALESFDKPWIEVHISNVWARESFRHDSVLSALSSGVIAGIGTDGYRLAAQALIEKGQQQ